MPNSSSAMSSGYDTTSHKPETESLVNYPDEPDLGLGSRDLEDPKVVRIKASNPLSADFRLALLSSALYSLKSTSLVKPYPTEYFDPETGEINREKLVRLLAFGR